MNIGFENNKAKTKLNFSFVLFCFAFADKIYCCMRMVQWLQCDDV